jgi:hypothetical protein
MAEDKTIVTKKTAPKAAATTKKTVTKKTPAKAATTGPGSTAAKQPAAAKPAATAGEKTTAKPSNIAAKPAAPKPASPVSTANKPAAPSRAKKTAAKPSPDAAQGGLQAKSISLKSLATVSEAERLHMVHEAAYYRAEKRSFAPGHEVEDWAEAEREIDELIANAKRISGR